MDLRNKAGEICVTCSLPSCTSAIIIIVTKPRNVRLARHMARMGENKYTQNFEDQNRIKRSLVRHRRTIKIILNWILKEITFDDMYWILSDW